MADQNTGADALGQYLTGAGSDGASQPDPDASLGNYRAAERLDPLGVLMAQGPPGLRIERVSGYNGVGAASLVAAGADAVAWRPPDDTEGEAIAIADGETRQVAGADEPYWANMSVARWAELTVAEWAAMGIGGSGLDGFAIVTRRSTEPLAGEFVAHLDRVVGNVVGGSRQTASGEAYRCVCLKNTTGDGKTLGLWHLADTAADGLADVATTTRDFTNHGAEHVPGQGYRFVKAENDYMQATVGALDAIAAVTMECWVRDWQTPIDSYGQIARFWTDSSNRLMLDAKITTDPASSYICASLKIGGDWSPTASWTGVDANALLVGSDPWHVAVVLDAPNTLRLFVNGILRAEVVPLGNELPIGTYYLILGYGSTAAALSAIVDEPRLSSAARYSATFTPDTLLPERAMTGVTAWLAPDRTPKTVAGNYGTAGATITVDGDLDDWPPTGWMVNKTTDEVLWYIVRTSTQLTVDPDGRDVWDETGGGAGVGMAGSAGDVLALVGPARIGKETPSAQPDGYFTTVSPETSAPGGVTFEHPWGSLDPTALDLGTVAAGEIVGLWIERMALAKTGGGRHAEPRRHTAVAVQWTEYLVHTHNAALPGLGRVGDTSVLRYGLWHGVDAEPDLTADPDETSDTLPFVYTAMTPDAVNYLVVRQRNDWGLWSQNTMAWQIELDAQGPPGVVAVKPSAPKPYAVEPAAGGDFRVVADYFYLLDGQWAAGTWVIWYQHGASPPDPDPDVDTPDATVTMAKSDGVACLDWTAGLTLTDGHTVKVVVRTRRVDAGPVNVDSANTGVVQATINTDGPPTPPAQAHYGVVAKEVE